MIRYRQDLFVGHSSSKRRPVASLSLARFDQDDVSPYDGYLGGAIVVASRWVLSAAHCLDIVGGFDGQGYLNLVGKAVALRVSTEPFLSDSAAWRPAWRRVQEVWRHPDYAQSPLRNDIALIKLDEPLEPANVVRVVIKRPAAGSFATAVGWGAARLVREVSHQVKEKGKVVIRKDAAMKNLELELGGNLVARYDPRTMLAAGGFAKASAVRRTGVCTGDSGGPLFSPRGVVGIASWSPRVCGATDGLPDVYVWIAAYRDWLRTTSGEDV